MLESYPQGKSPIQISFNFLANWNKICFKSVCTPAHMNFQEIYGFLIYFKSAGIHTKILSKIFFVC